MEPNFWTTPLGWTIATTGAVLGSVAGLCAALSTLIHGVTEASSFPWSLPYAAFDLALDKLVERLRRNKDRKKIHRGQHTPLRLQEAAADNFSQVDVVPADTDTIRLVENGGTVVIGGIYTQKTADSTQRIPFFGDLPYIGWLFKNREWIDDKTELLVFITPKIVAESLAVR